MSRRGPLAAMGAAIIAVACTGTAKAYWSGHGTGAGTGATGTISLNASVTVVSGLYPGATVPVSVTLKNTSAAGNLTITALSQSGATTIQTAGKGSCNPSVVTFAVGALPSGALAPNQTGTATGSVTMTTAAADGCQGTTFAIPLIANGKLG
ncbi:MAG TPA: hypothetical protein VHW74_07235 [Mycobacteriales bacterium]|nr:hypothetical protein [Mycobacteriales bacterium]